MIIDFHTHIFPPEVRDQRADYAARQQTFAEMYADTKAKIATAEDLLASMDEAGVDMSVALGFAWHDHETTVRHNDYVLEAAANSGGRIVPFCTVNMAAEGASGEIARCAAAGARGLGELRPENQGWELNGDTGERLAEAARKQGLILLFHVTEPGGHEYAGKEGLQLGAFYRFQMDHPDVRIVGAHLGGGLPMSAPVSQMKAIAAHVAFDTAAQPHLYGNDVYGRLLSGPFRKCIVMGSDYPLISQKRQIDVIQKALPPEEAERVLGANAEHFLGVQVGRPSG